MVRNTTSGRAMVFSLVIGIVTVARSGNVSVRRGRGARGFTLIELLIVISLIGILASIAIPSYNKSVIRAREATLRKNLYHMREAIDKFYGDHEIYPDSLIELVDKKYIRIVPVDPLTSTSDSWIEIPSEDGSGIFDVISGSDKASRSGVAYSQW